MSNDLEANIKAYEAELANKADAHKKACAAMQIFLPVIVLFVKPGESQDPVAAQAWFDGTESHLMTKNDDSPTDLPFVSDLILAMEEAYGYNTFNEVIVIKNANSKDAGALLAKTTSKFGDIISIDRVDQIEMISGLAHFYDNFTSISSAAAHLRDSLVECYKYLRDYYVLNGFDKNSFADFIEPIYKYSGTKNLLSDEAEKLLKKLKI